MSKVELTDFKLEKSPWPSGGYYYLSREDSDLYDEAKDSDDEKDKQIVKLILQKAQTCRGAHVNSNY
jgi:hypothetical protein